MKKMLSILLCAVILSSLVSSLFSCVSTQNSNSVQSTSSTSKWLEFFWDDGTVVSFLVAEQGGGTNGTYSHRSISVDSTSADSVDQAIYKRNQKIEKRLGLEIDLIDAYPDSLMNGNNGTFVTSLQANSGDYDVIVGYQAYDMGLATKGILLDINDLERYDANYIDLSQPWWAGNYINELSYKGRAYWLTGDIMLRYLSETCCVFVNGDLYEKYLFNKYGSFYEIVKKREWTMDLMKQMTEEIYQDTGTITNVVDKEDIFGYVITDLTYDALAVSAGVQWTTRDENGDITISLNNSHTIDFVYKSIELHEAKGVLNDRTQAHSTFTGGKALFLMSALYVAELYLREMNNFYVVPFPMYDLNQKDYITNIWDSTAIVGICAGSDDIKASAVLLEALAAESYRSVTPIYYDEALKYKYTRDDDAAAMIDIMRDSIYTDFAFAWGNSIGAIHNFFRSGTNDSISSALKSNTKQWNKMLGKLIEKLEELDVE